MNIFKTFWKILCPDYKKLYTISGDDVRDRIASTTGESLIIIVDNEYTIYSEKDIGNFLFNDATNLKTYIKDKYDCDDFAFKLYTLAREKMKGIPFGVAFVTLPDGKKHALNCFINENQNFKMIEPQTDEIFLADKKGYSIDFVLI